MGTVVGQNGNPRERWGGRGRREGGKEKDYTILV